MAERLTNRGIAALKPSDMSVLHFDSEVSGLAVRIYPSGQKSFVFDWRENHRQRRKTIGQFPAWTIGKARTHASRARPGWSWPSRSERDGRDRSDQQWRAVVKLTRRSAPWSATRLPSIIYRPGLARTIRAVTRNRIEAGTARWRSALIRPIAVWVCCRRSVRLARQEVTSNPCRSIRRCPENQRHVFLDADETGSTAP